MALKLSATLDFMAIILKLNAYSNHLSYLIKVKCSGHTLEILIQWVSWRPGIYNLNKFSRRSDYSCILALNLRDSILEAEVKTQFPYLHSLVIEKPYSLSEYGVKTIIALVTSGKSWQGSSMSTKIYSPLCPYKL